MGFESIDLVGLRGLCDHVPSMSTPEELRAAGRQFRASHLRASSINADPGSFDGYDDTDAVMSRVENLLALALECEVPLLVLPAGEKTEAPVADRQIGRMTAALNQAADRAREKGVRLAVEAPYFGRPVDNIDLANEMLAGLDPYVELAFDVSHIEAADESVITAWELFSSRVGIVHLRDADSRNVRRVIGAGRVDFAAFYRAMAATAYRGDIVLELETRDSPYATKEDEVLAAVAYLNEIVTEDKEVVR
ncbi:sugar phosphate isomerase/epimerase family protein [Microbacterium sp. NPDC058062]|uniref:sugar phosphate isomerase/epimerase family protein n=1 Tax=Microbacterium sp. NPDC058062 TaxID=3346320 RepID=UPI0036D92128